MIKQVLRNSFLSAVGMLVKPAFGIHILNGHFISRRDQSIDTFNSLMNHLLNVGQLMRIEEAVELIMGGEIPTRESHIAFTFDDGFEECYTMIAPTLEKFGINAAFFVNPGFINGDKAYCDNFTSKVVMTPGKNPMTWGMVSELHKRGHVIGSHTYDHKKLSDLDEREIEIQIKRSKEEIEDHLQDKCEWIAYPYGQHRDITESGLEIVMRHHKVVFSGCNYKEYFSFGGRVINRRHFEGDWPPSHLTYFMSMKRPLQSIYSK